MLAAGTVVAGHRIESLLGEGGMATVYEAHQISLNRVVALKILARRIGDDPAFRERFRRECEMQARLDHPHIVPVYAAGESEHGLWLTMRLVRGPTLRELLLAERLSPSRALELLAPIAKAVDVAHEYGLIHRDITPQNILVDERGHPYLADFGITKGRGDRSLTRTGQFVGTLDYVAPEQIRDEPTGPATDVYSLAAILFECLTGRVPYDKGSEAAVLFAHIDEDPPRASAIEGALPATIDPILEKGLAKLPEDRYRKASDLVSAAEAALRGRVGGPRPTPPPSPTGSGEARPSSRRVLLLGLAFAVLSSAALALGAFAGNPASSTTTQVSAGKLAIDLPSGWAVTKSVKSGVPGLALEDPVILRPRAGGGSITVGVSSAKGKTLLPPALRQTPNGPVRGTPVSLGTLEALRYRGLRAPGTVKPLMVFVSPTSVGVATVACRPYQAGTELVDACRRLTSTLELTEGRPFPLGPSPSLAAKLRRRLTALTERRDALRHDLSVAERSLRQAAMADRLARAFGSTARALSATEVTPQSATGLDAVVSGLRSTREAYMGLATAARQEDASRYADAAGKAVDSEAVVDRRLLALRRLGYRVGASG